MKKEDYTNEGLINTNEGLIQDLIAHILDQYGNITNAKTKYKENPKKVLEQALIILSSNKSYYWNKDWVLKYRKK